jgi:serine/threonine protein kinase/TolB-like protein/Tfp pilus assembly protein PilF
MSLTTIQMARMSKLLDEALPLDEPGRRSWLEALPDAERDLALPLREALLGSTYESDSAFTLFGAGEESSDMSGLQPGASIGPYQLIRLLGSGGMAEVWLAQRADGAFKRRVALKVPALAPMRKDLGQRFARERDILASLEHPHIARLYDAGVDAAGWPYLSMEYVRGEPLTEWCDVHRVGIRGRVQLFLQVLTAVQYAHERHVIHRDLKPSNILVTEAGQVRLLDFGVAKLLQSEESADEASLTRAYGQALTPVYASPESVRGDPVGPKSDIYSLGVLLFELLAGNRPYRLKAGASPSMLEHAIAAAEVQRPSTQTTPEAPAMRGLSPDQLVRQLRGDLDLIVLKTLEKDPGARYASAAALADDLQCHLDGKPVTAQPPRMRYRLKKFIRRNRNVAAVVAAAIIAVAAIAGYEEATRRAGQRAADRALAAATTAELRKSDKSIAVLPFLDLSEAKDQGYFADGLSEELIDLLAQIQSLEVIARTSSFYFKGKDVPVPEIAAKLGVAHVLEGSVRRAGHTVRVTAQLIRADSGVHLWSQTYDRDVTDIFKVQDDIASAVVGALKLKLLPTQQVVDPYRSDIAEAYNQYLLGREFGRHGDAANLERAVGAYRKAATLDPQYAVAYVGLAFTETRLANSAPDTAGARARFERAHDAVERALALAPQLADAYRARASLRLETLDFAGARADGEKALALAPGDSRVQSLYGVGLAAFGRLPEAIGAMDRAVGLDPLNSFAWANLGLFLTANDDYPAARGALDRALAINPDDFASHLALAQLDLLEGRLDDARKEFPQHGGEALRRMGDAMIEHALGHEHESQQALKELIAKHAKDMAYQVGDVYAWLGDNDRAFEWLDRAYAQRDSGLNGVQYDPLLAHLHNDPRYQALLGKLQLSR